MGFTKDTVMRIDQGRTPRRDSFYKDMKSAITTIKLAPGQSKIYHCNRCGTPFTWGKTARGKWFPYETNGDAHRCPHKQSD